MQGLFEAWCRWMQARGSCKITKLNSDGRRGGEEPYLERYYILKTSRFSLFLHRFWSSDPEGVHDHPWDWGRLILCGGYTEEGADGVLSWRPAGSFVYRQPAEVFHRVHIAEPGATWTLFWHWRRRRLWGYLNPGDTAWVESLGNVERPELRGTIFPRLTGKKTSAVAAFGEQVPKPGTAPHNEEELGWPSRGIGALLERLKVKLREPR